MKVAIVPATEITAKRGLDAKFYVTPVADIDAAITRAENTIAKAQDRIARLRVERERVMAGHTRTIFPNHAGHYR